MRPIFRNVWRRANALRLRIILKTTVRRLSYARTVKEYIDILGEPHDRVEGEIVLSEDEGNKILEDEHFAFRNNSLERDKLRARWLEAARQRDDAYIGDSGWVFYVGSLMLVAYEKDGVVRSLSGQAVPTSTDRAAGVDNLDVFTFTPLLICDHDDGPATLCRKWSFK